MYFPLFERHGCGKRSGMPPKTIDSEIPKQKRTGKPSSLSVQYFRLTMSASRNKFYASASQNAASK